MSRLPIPNKLLDTALPLGLSECSSEDGLDIAELVLEKLESSGVDFPYYLLPKKPASVPHCSVLTPFIIGITSITPR